MGKGGEGIVYDLKGNPRQVAKIYHSCHRTIEREQKLEAMIFKPPQYDTRRMSPPHISIAWPLELLYEQRKFVGYIMPRIEQCSNILEVYNPQLRAKKYTEFNWKFLHRTARNLATALNALHVHRYIMGDVNQKNILVNTDALVTLVDTDSFQVQDSNGKIYRCPVGVPDYTPPELQSQRLDSVDRTTNHDNFGLAVIIFQLLMEGFHPFMGLPKEPTLCSFEEIYLHNIKQGIFPYQRNYEFNPPPGAPLFKTLHPEIQNLFFRCFVDGHHNPSSRPTPLEWLDALEKAETALVNCKYISSHWYSNHLKKCPWCEREQQKPLRVQQILPPIKPQKQKPAPTLQKTSPAIPSFHPSPIKTKSKIVLPVLVVFAFFLFFLLFKGYAPNNKKNIFSPGAFSSGDYEDYLETGKEYFYKKEYEKALRSFKTAQGKKNTPELENLIKGTEKRLKILQLKDSLEKNRKDKNFDGMFFNLIDLKGLTGKGFIKFDLLEEISMVDDKGQNKIVLGGIPFVYIKPGTFQMGCFNSNERFVLFDAVPVHEVELEGFWISRTEITEQQFKKGYSNFPVCSVDWSEAINFAKKFGEKYDLKADLPTEAQWEFAARNRGQEIVYPWGYEIDKTKANYRDTGGVIMPVASFSPNPLGIFDISGNLREWCRDYYSKTFYSIKKTKVKDPLNSNPNEEVVVRGGCYADGELALKTYVRYSRSKNSADQFTGFRIVLEK